MKRFLKTKLFAAMFVAAILAASTVKADIGALGPDTPFPWAVPVPFPWATIQGTWKIKLNNYETFFSFEIRNNLKSSRTLSVRNFDLVTGNVMASGVGVADSDQLLVRATMNADGYKYIVTVHSFKNMTNKNFPGLIHVLSVRPLNAVDGSSELHYIMQKVSDCTYTQMPSSRSSSFARVQQPSYR